MAAQATPSELANYVRVLNDQNPEGAAAVYTEDATVTQAVLNGSSFTGREEIAGWIGDNLAGLPDLEEIDERIVQCDDQHVWEGTYTGSTPASSRARIPSRGRR